MKVAVPMYEPLQVSKCEKCGKIIRKGEIYVSAHGAYLGAGMFIPQNKYHKRCFEAKFLRQDGKEKTTLDMLSDSGKKGD